MSGPRIIDLFAGCGGLSCGFLRQGFDSVLAVESDVFAAASYGANFGIDHVFPGRIDQWIRTGSTPDAEVVIGGPPCQGFSQLGSGDPADPRNGLWRDYLQVVARVRPRVFVLENVERFIYSNELLSLRRRVARSPALRYYTLTPFVLNAADYGSAQVRKRAILLGTREDVTPFAFDDPPPPSHSKMGASGTPHWLGVREVIGHVPWDTTYVDLPPARVRMFDQDLPGVFRTDELHVGRTPTAMSRRRYRYIPPGGNRHDLPETLQAPCWRRHKGGAGDVMGRLKWDDPAVTIRTEFFKPEKGRYLHPQHEKRGPQVNRPITHREAALIQGFPDDFLWCGSKVSIARQIGNAVPIPLAEAIAGHVLQRL